MPHSSVHTTTTTIEWWPACVHLVVLCACRYLEVLLRRVSMGQVVYSRNYKAFVTLTTDADKQGLPVQSEEYADLMGTVITTSVLLSLLAMFAQIECYAAI